MSWSPQILYTGIVHSRLFVHSPNVEWGPFITYGMHSKKVRAYVTTVLEFLYSFHLFPLNLAPVTWAQLLVHGHYAGKSWDGTIAEGRWTCTALKCPQYLYPLELRQLNNKIESCTEDCRTDKGYSHSLFSSHFSSPKYHLWQSKDMIKARDIELWTWVGSKKEKYNLKNVPC